MKKLRTAEEERKIVAYNLNRLINASNKTKADLVRYLKPYGISETTVYSWFNAKRYPRVEALQLLSDYFNVVRSDITDDRVNKESEFEKVYIPYYDSVSAGALAVVDGHTKSSTKKIDMPAVLLGRYAHDSGLFAMKVNGESMNMVIPNGSYVIAKPCDIYRDGDIVIFSYDGQYALKRYLPHAVADAILFKAETTDSRIKDITVSLSSDLETKIYGRVIWYSVILP